MTRTANTYRVGNATVTRIDELTLSAFGFETLYPSGDPAALERHRARLGPGSFDPQAGSFVQSIHTWLVRTPRHTILVDTATGNDKERPGVPPLHHLNEPYLERLAAAGVQPTDVGHVLITHLHSDHVGWNTRLVHGQWRATFTNARHLFTARENAYNATLAAGGTPGEEPCTGPALGPMVRTPAAGVYADSVMPVIEAGLVDLVEANGGEVLDGFSYLPTPGHSIDHASIRFRSQGEEALFCGDVMHHPLQVYAPELASCFCEFPEAAQRSRRWVLDRAAETGAMVFSSHFAETSAGRVTRTGERFDWSFV